MNKGKVLGGVLTLALVGVGIAALKSGGIHLPVFSKSKSIELPKGTKIQLVLADALSSGGSKEGDEASFLVTEDIVFAKRTIIERGTAVKATVTVSRAASDRSQSARLEITFKPVETLVGQAVKVGPVKGDTFAFTQENTSRRKNAAKIDRLWSTEEGKKALQDLQASSTQGGLHIPEGDSLRSVADGIGMEKTKKFLDSPRGGQQISPQKMLEAVGKGDLLALAGVDKVLALQALDEIGSVTTAITDKIGGIFKGNDINAPAGTPITVVTKEKLVFDSGE